MKKVYILFNCDINEVMAVSEDKQLIQEIMCDYFMEDIAYDWFWATQVENYSEDRLGEIATDIWYNMLNWYDMQILILENEVI